MNANTKLHIANFQEWTQHFIDQHASGIDAEKRCAMLKDAAPDFFAVNVKSWLRQSKSAAV